MRYKKTANSQRGNIQDAKKLAESKGGLCLSEIYENAREPLIWQCENGHTWPASYYSVKGSSKHDGTWCKSMTQIDRSFAF